jgi:A/G-specific DNA glycosylase
VDRVIPYWEKWRKVLPDYQSLAKVNKSDLLTLWSGLGFNSRALRLQSCAQAVVEKY